MFLNVTGVTNNNRNIIETSPRLTQATDDLNNYVNEIKNIAVKTGMDTTGITEAKIESKDKMATLGSEIAAAIRAYAHDNNNLQLAAAVDYSYSDIRYTTHIESLQIANVILEETENHINELSGYMVSSGDAVEYRGCVSNFEELSENKGQVKSSSVAQTKHLTQLFKETDDLLTKTIDLLIFRMKRKYPLFYDTYMNARNIANY
jgi:hypothetical protein